MLFIYENINIYYWKPDDFTIIGVAAGLLEYKLFIDV